MSNTAIKNVLTLSSVADRLQLRIQSIAASVHEDPQAALMLCERTFVEAREQRLPPIQLQAATHYGLIMDHLGRAADARDWLFEALQLAQTHKLQLHEAPLRELIARSYYTTGEYDRALQYWAECLESCERGSGDVRSWMLAKVGLGQIYDTLGDHASAVALHRSAHEHINDVRDSYLEAKVKINLGVNLLRLHELDEAEQFFGAALALCRTNFYHDYVAESLLGLARIALAWEDLDAALAHLAGALAEADRVGYSWGQSQILSTLAEAKARQGDMGGAIATVRRGQQISRAGGINHLLSQQHFALAGYAEQQGDLRTALDETKAGLVLERYIREQLNPDRRRELEDRAGLHPSSPQRLAGLLNNPLIASGAIEDFFQLLTRESCGAINVARAGVWLLEPGGDALRSVCIYDAAENKFADPMVLARGEVPSLFEWLAQDLALVAYDAAEHRDSRDLSPVYLEQRGVRSLLAFALRPLDRAMGLLMVEHQGSQRNWTPADTLAVQQIADAATRALANRERVQFQRDTEQRLADMRQRLEQAQAGGQADHPASGAPRQPVILGPGEGRAYPMGRISAVFKADRDETASRYSVSEWWLEPRTQGPGAHQHAEDDLFYVIAGTMSVRVGDDWVHAQPGAFVLVPGGTLHDFENRGDVRAGVLNFSVPGGFEVEMPGIAEWFAQNPPKDTQA